MPTLTEEADSPAEKHVALRNAVGETRAVLKIASSQWAAHSCPGTAECCQLKTTQRFPWLWPTEWIVLQARLKRDGREIPSERRATSH